MTNELRLSHSQIEAFEQCAYKWKLQKIDRVAQAPAVALIFGDAIHQAIEADGKAAVAGAQRLSLQALVTRFSLTLTDRLAADDRHGLLTPQRNAMMLRGLAILRQYVEQFQPTYHPTAVEEPFPEVLIPATYAGMPDVRFSGRLDARAGDTILDFKTAGKPWQPGIEHQKPQALAYLWADQRARDCDQSKTAATKVSFVVLTTTEWRNRNEMGYLASVDVRTTAPRTGQIMAYAQRVGSVARQIAEAKHTGRFWANTGPLCGWCGYLGSCKEGQKWLRLRERTPAVPMVNAAGAPVMWETKEVAG